MVDTTDPQTLPEEGELCLRVLAELDAFVHCADDNCLAQELVRDKLPRPNCDSERDAAVGVLEKDSSVDPISLAKCTGDLLLDLGEVEG